MKNSIILKNADKTCIDAISQIEIECFSDPWSKNAIEQFISYPQNTILCAFSGDTLCGYVSGTLVMDEMQIANVAVSESFRRQSIASVLIEAIINKCYSQNISFATLEVRTSNTPAINLYTKFGFNAEGIRKNYYKNPTEDAIIMKRYFKKGT